MIVLLHVAIGIAVLVIYLARRPANGRRAWLDSIVTVGKRIEHLEDCKEAEITYARALMGQLEAVKKERDALQFENRVVQTDRTVLLVKNLDLQRLLDDCKAEK